MKMLELAVHPLLRSRSRQAEEGRSQPRHFRQLQVQPQTLSQKVRRRVAEKDNLRLLRVPTHVTTPRGGAGEAGNGDRDVV